MAPVRKIQVQHNYVPWFTEDIETEVNKRDDAQRKAEESGNPDHWKEWRKIRNSVTKKVRKAKKLWRKEKLIKCNGDPNKLWKHVKNWLNWSTTGSPTQLYDVNSVSTSPNRNANIMNSY